mgnify:CR=1 FL=1
MTHNMYTCRYYLDNFSLCLCQNVTQMAELPEMLAVSETKATY